mgnify:CR=1 FL=1
MVVGGYVLVGGYMVVAGPGGYSQTSGYSQISRLKQPASPPTGEADAERTRAKGVTAAQAGIQKEPPHMAGFPLTWE